MRASWGEFLVELEVGGGGKPRSDGNHYIQWLKLLRSVAEVVTFSG